MPYMTLMYKLISLHEGWLWGWRFRVNSQCIPKPKIYMMATLIRTQALP